MDDGLKGGHGRKDLNKDAAAAVQEDLLFGAVTVELRTGFETCCRKKKLDKIGRASCRERV